MALLKQETTQTSSPMLGGLHKNPFCVFAVTTLFAVRSVFAVRTLFAVNTYLPSAPYLPVSLILAHIVIPHVLTNYLHNLYLLFMFESHHS
jgi:hypothetical protein